MSYSLQGRLGVGLIIGLVCLFVVQWIIVSISVRTLAENYVATRLGHDADTLLAAVNFDENDQEVIDHSSIDSIYRVPFSGHYFQLMLGNHIVYSRSLWDQTLALPTKGALPKELHIEGPRSQPLLVRVYHFTKQDRQFTVVLGEDLTILQKGLRKFQLLYALVSFLLLMVVMVIQIWGVRHGLKPLETVRQDVRRLELGEVSQLSERVPMEILPLVREFNRLLELMQQRLSRSRTALGNLAHALKTPLTVLSRMADQDDVHALPAVREQLLQQTGTIRQLLDHQLKRARLAGAAAPGWQFRVKEELTPLVDTLGRIYSDKRLEIVLDVDSQHVFSGDREDLLELFGNLLDNACKWAKTQVKLTVDSGEGLVFSVEDDGPGCAPEMCDALTRRGVRVDESTLGHGLGLAIVKDVVDQYQGTLVFDRSQTLGGFRVAVSLPNRPFD